MTQHLTRSILIMAVAGLTGCEVKPPDKLEPGELTQRDAPSEPTNGATTTADTESAPSSVLTTATDHHITRSKPERSETADRDIPVWTSIRGDTIQADFVRMEDSLCVLRTADGTLIRVPLDHLSPASADRVQALTQQ